MCQISRSIKLSFDSIISLPTVLFVHHKGDMDWCIQRKQTRAFVTEEPSLLLSCSGYGAYGTRFNFVGRRQVGVTANLLRPWVFSSLLLVSTTFSNPKFWVSLLSTCHLQRVFLTAHDRTY